MKKIDDKIIIMDLIKTIQSHKEHLSEIDGAIGDGDHGINMNKGFTKSQKKLEDKDLNLASSFKVLGTTLLTEIGGAMGPLYGTFFLEMSRAIKEEEEINKELFGKMLSSALKGIERLSDASVGDKTMLDTMVPAVRVYNQAVQEGSNFKKALEKMKTAAEEGKESTRDMIAKVGRASRLGKRSQGVLDPGATSCNLILQSIADSIIKQL